MSDTPLLSIVVPTKNRYKYLFCLIELIEGFKSEEIELVIQDNSDDNSEIMRFCNKTVFTNLKYYHTEESISVVSNSDKAVLHSTGEYVCVIGDDDGITSDIVNQVKIMKDKGYEAMLTRLAIYNWPDYVDNSCFRLSGTMTVDKMIGRNNTIDPKAELLKVCKNGFKDIGRLPKVYQAVVKRSTLDKIYDKCGTFFPGPSPDMANAIALSSLVDKVWYNEKPTIITGQCKSVGGGERLLDKLVPLTEVAHLPKDILSYWDNKLPVLWCSDTIWPGSAYIAAKRMNMNLVMDYNQIYGRFVFNHPQYKNAISNFQYNILIVDYYRCKFLIQKGIRWINNRLSYYISGKKRIHGQTLFRNLPTIQEASFVLSKL